METNEPNVYPTILGGVSRGFWSPFLDVGAPSATFWHLKTGTFGTIWTCLSSNNSLTLLLYSWWYIWSTPILSSSGRGALEKLQDAGDPRLNQAQSGGGVQVRQQFLHHRWHWWLQLWVPKNLLHCIQCFTQHDLAWLFSVSHLRHFCWRFSILKDRILANCILIWLRRNQRVFVMCVHTDPFHPTLKM